MTDKKKLIINFLKRKKRSSTPEIAIVIKSNFWMAEQYLYQLESEKKIQKEVYGKIVYWRLK